MVRQNWGGWSIGIGHDPDSAILPNLEILARVGLNVNVRAGMTIQ
jgi:hypothetical protein